MAYCMYLRKSRADREAEARGEGETLARHEKTLRELANRLGITVIRVDREIVSGETLASRPVMQKLLREVEAGLWEGVLVMEIERLARGDTIDQGLVARAFKTSGTSILTPLKIYDPANEFDEEYFEFGLFMSRREYKTINRRLQRGRLSSVSEGKYVGSVAPYGYRRIKLSGEKGYTLEPVEQEAEAVRALFSLYASGETLAAVAERLNRLAYPSPSGGLWSAPSVQGIVRNPVYAGFLRWQARPRQQSTRPRRPPLLFPGRHPPLVDSGLWALAESRTRHRSSRRESPLAGLVLCAVCGRPMTRKSQRSGRDSLLCRTPGCPTVSCAHDLVERRILDAAALCYPDLHLSLSGQDPYVGRRRTLAAQIARLPQLTEAGVYDLAAYGERRRILEDALTALPPPPAPETYDFARLRALYEKLPPNLRRALLLALFSRIEYARTDGGRWKDPTRFTLRLTPRLSLH